MSITSYAKRTVALRVLRLMKRVRVTAAAVLILLAGVGSQDVGLRAVENVTPIVEEAKTRPPKAVEYPYAAFTVTTAGCLTAGVSPSAGTVMAGLSGDNAGFSSAVRLCVPAQTGGRTTVDEKSVLSEIDQLIQTGSRLGVFGDWEGRRLLNCARHGVVDSFIIGRIRRRVEKALRRVALSGSPFLPPRLDRGDFLFGYDMEGHELHCDASILNAHILQIGNTGCGKTTGSKYRAIRIAPCVDGMWLIDIRKHEYRSLRGALATLGINLKIVRSHSFRLNPLQVPQTVEPIEYAAIAADILVRGLRLPPRASTLLRSTVLKLYMQYGVLDGGDRFPCLFHLFEAIRADRSANPQARLATLDNLEALLIAMGPGVLAYHRGWDVHELARQHLVMELAGLPEAGKDLILNYLLSAEFTSRIARGVSNPRMDLYVSFDEAQRLFSQKWESNSYGGNALIDLTGLVRGVGVGLEISVLTTHDLSAAIPSLTATKIVGRCGSMAEYRAAGQFMGLNSEQVTWCAHHLVPGLFVGQIGEGSWRYPFVFRVPWVGQRRRSPSGDQEPTTPSARYPQAQRCLSPRLHGTEVSVNNEPKTVSDDEADRSLESLITGSVVPATGFRPLLGIAQATVTITDSDRSHTPTAEMRLLREIVRHPLLPSSEYPSLAKIAPNTLQKLRPNLVRRGLIKVQKFEPGGRPGRGTLCLEPLDAARELVATWDAAKS